MLVSLTSREIWLQCGYLKVKKKKTTHSSELNRIVFVLEILFEQRLLYLPRLVWYVSGEHIQITLMGSVFCTKTNALQ